MVQPLISFTLRLPKPLKGSELKDLTKEIAELVSAFYCQPDPANRERLLIGQASGYPTEQVLVAASAEQLGIELGATYEEVTVLSHDHGGGFAVIYADDQVVTAVWEFASELFRRLLGRDSYSERDLRLASHQ